MKNKVDEYTFLDKLGIPHDFNHDTIYREVDRYGWQVKTEDAEKLKEKKEIAPRHSKPKKDKIVQKPITKDNLVDKDVYIATKELKPIVRNF